MGRSCRNKKEDVRAESALHASQFVTIKADAKISQIIDAPGILHHVIGRGIERKKIFFNDTGSKMGAGLDQ